MQLRGEVTPHIGRHAFAVLATLKGMLLETLQKVFGHKSITYVLRIHSLVRRRRGNLFLEVAHLYGQRADQLSQLLIRACFNNCQFHTKILFKFLNMRQSKAHFHIRQSPRNQSRPLACIVSLNIQNVKKTSKTLPYRSFRLYLGKSKTFKAHASELYHT